MVLPSLLFLKNNFIYFWLYGVFIPAWLFSSCREQGILSTCGAQVSHCDGGFSWCRAWVLGHLSFSSCGTWAHLQLPGSQTQAQELWCMGPGAPWCVGSSRTRDRNRVSHISRRTLHHWAIREAAQFFFLFFCLSSKHPHSLQRITYASILYS